MAVTIHTFIGFKDAWVSVADKDAVLACFGTEAHFSTHFGGFLQYRNFDTDQRWWGVWGRRNASRFRRRMRAHWVEVKLVPEPPPEPARMAWAHLVGIRLSAEERRMVGTAL